MNKFKRIIIFIVLLISVQTILPFNTVHAAMDLESAFASLVTSCANGITYLIYGTINGGKTLTIDDVIFNNFPQTRLDIFGKYEDPNGVDTRPEIVQKMAEGINTWYAKFRTIAVLGYVILLLYMAVRILAGTGASKKADFKDFILYWVKGILILFVFPYVIKYMIQINNAIVEGIEISKNTLTANLAFTDSGTTDMNNSPENIDFENIEVTGNDFISILRARAQKTRRLVDAFVFLVMAYQMMAILILYYKRVFMVTFLLAIFPLVALFYAIDKIGDGKSQAFDKWTKEITFNIIVQIFHAILYTFAFGATYNAGDIENPDVVIMFIGIRFLFSGEEIIKGIFSQNSSAGTMTNLQQTAAKSVATVAAVKNVGKNLKDNVIGKKSHLGRLRTAKQEAKMYKSMEKSFDNVATTNHTPQMQNYNLSDNENENLYTAQAAVDTINNKEFATPEQNARAFAFIQNNINDPRFKDTFKNLNMSQDTLNKLNILDGKVANISKNGGVNAARDINQTIDAMFEIMIPDNPLERKVMKDAYVTKVALYGTHLNRETSKVGVMSEYEESRQRVEEIKERINRASEKTTENAELEQTINLRAAELVEDAAKGRKVSEYEERKATKVARVIAMYENSEKFTKEEIFKETQGVLKDVGESELAAKVQRIAGIDINEHNHMLSKELSENISDEDLNNMSPDEQIEHSKVQMDAINNVLEYEKEDSQYEYDDAYTVHEAIRNGDLEEDEVDNVVECILNERRNENLDEIKETRRNAEALMRSESIDKNVAELKEEATIDGYTLGDIQDLRRASKHKVREEKTRAATTIIASTTLAPAGALIGAVWHGDDTNIVEGAGTGALAGAALGDKIAETAAGSKKQKIEVINPETGEIITVDAQLAGAFSTLAAYEKGVIIEGLTGRWKPADKNIVDAVIKERMEKRKAAQKKLEEDKKI